MGISITLEAGFSPLITINNFGSQGTPAKFQDIYDVDCANAWGVFFKDETGSWRTTARLLFSGTTWFQWKDETLYQYLTRSGSHFPIQNSATLEIGDWNTVTLLPNNQSGGQSWIVYFNDIKGNNSLYSPGICYANSFFFTALPVGKGLSLGLGTAGETIYAYNVTSGQYGAKIVQTQKGFIKHCIINNGYTMTCEWQSTIEDLVFRGMGNYGLYSRVYRDTTVRNAMIESCGANQSVWLNCVGDAANPHNFTLVGCTWDGGCIISGTYADVGTGNRLIDKQYWQPTVGYKVGDVFTPWANRALALVDGKGATVYTGTSDANGQYDFTSATGTANVNPNDTTIVELTNFTKTGSSETLDDEYKDHVATFSGAGHPTHIYPLVMDRSRKNDEIVLVPYTVPAVPVITTAETTVTEPCVDLSGTATDAEDISVSVEVGGIEKARPYPVAGAWSCTVPLAAGANTIRAREINDEGIQSGYCVTKTFTYQQYTIPAIPTITTLTQTISATEITIIGTAQSEEDISVELQNNSVTYEIVDVDASGNWEAKIPLDVGSNVIRAREVNENTPPDVSGWSSTITITVAASPVAPVITTVNTSTYYNNIDISGTAETDTTIKLYIGGVDTEQNTYTASGTWKVEALKLSVGSNKVKAKAVKNIDGTLFESGFSNEITITLYGTPSIPAITSPSSGLETYEEAYDVSGTCQANVLVRAFVNGTDSGQQVYTTGTTWVIREVHLGVGDNSIKVTAERKIDGTTYQSGKSAAITITRNSVITAPPPPTPDNFRDVEVHNVRGGIIPQTSTDPKTPKNVRVSGA